MSHNFPIPYVSPPHADSQYLHGLGYSVFFISFSLIYKFNTNIVWYSFSKLLASINLKFKCSINYCHAYMFVFQWVKKGK